MEYRTTLAGILAATFVFLQSFAHAAPRFSSAPAARATATESSPYPVFDSGAWADWHGYTQNIYWIDNDRVIFWTVKDNEKKRVSSGPFNLSVWDTAVADKVTSRPGSANPSGSVKPYTEYYQSVTVCIQGGMIHRTQKDAQGNVQRFYGKFGEEKTFEFPKTKGAFFDEMNCRPNDNPEILAKRQAGRAIKPLLDRHGYLDVGPIKRKPGVNEPAVYYPFGQPKGIELPISSQDANIVRYYPFKGAYLIHSHNYGGGTRSKGFWWLYPDGKVEEHSIPVETNPYPTRKGIVTRRGPAEPNRDTSAAGLYLWSGKEPVKLLAGYAEDIDVSPDGCKLAFSHYLHRDATLIKHPAPITLKAINLCTEEKSHGK